MKISKYILLGLAAVSTALNASAFAPKAGWYISGMGSINSLHSSSEGSSDLKGGGGGSLIVGYYLRDRIRLEAEWGTQQNDYKTDYSIIYFLRPYGWTPGGVFRRDFLMMNMMFDFPLSERWDINLGAGLGVMRFSNKSPYQPVIAIYPPPPDMNRYSNVDRIAGQLMGGFTFHLTPRLAFTAGYRLAEAEKASHGWTRINTGPFSSAEFGIRIKL